MAMNSPALPRRGAGRKFDEVTPRAPGFDFGDLDGYKVDIARLTMRPHKVQYGQFIRVALITKPKV